MRMILTSALLLSGCGISEQSDSLFLDQLDASLDTWAPSQDVEDRLPSPFDYAMFSCVESLDLAPEGAFHFDVHVEPGHQVGCAMGADWRRFGPDISGRIGCEDMLRINLAGPRLVGMATDDDGDGVVQITGTIPSSASPSDSTYFQCVDLDACTTTFPAQLVDLPSCDEVPDCPEYTFAIDEVMSINERSFANPEGEYCPYFNLTNTGELPVDISGWTLGDGSSTETLGEDTTLEPGGHLTQFACGDPASSVVPSATGGTLTLNDTDPFDGADLAPRRDCTAAEVTYPAMAADQAFAHGEVTDLPSPGSYLWLSELNLAPPEEGAFIRVQGVVTATKDSGFFMQSRGSEAYTGAWVYHGTDTEYSFSPGDFVEAGGLYDDYYGMTEVNAFYGEVLHFDTLDPREPVVISSADAGEAWEGMFVRVDDLTVTVGMDSSGQFYVADGSGIEMPVDNGLFDDLALFSLTTVGTHYEFIQGVLDYSWDEFEINPRDAADFEITGGLPVLEPTPAEVPYLESFAGQNGRGVSGPDASIGGDDWFMDDVSWTLEVDAAGLTADDDYALVIEETMSMRDVDGLITWSSPELPVSLGGAYLVSVDVRGYGGLEADDTFTATVDGVTFADFSDDSGDFPFPADWTFSSVCLEASSEVLQVVIQAQNNSGSEYIEFDNVAVSEGCDLPEPEPEPDLPITLISDIQTGLVDLDAQVAIEGVVTALTTSGLFIQDDDAAWSGIYVYSPDLVDPKIGSAAVGDYVRIEGTYTEYSDLSELVDITVYEVISTGLVVEPVPLDSLLDPADHEMYEGVLVHVTAPMTVVNADLGYGEWLISDDLGQLMVLDDLVSADVDLLAPHCLGAPYDEVTGIMTFTYEAYKILPLSPESIVTIPDVADHSDCDEDGYAPLDGDCNDFSNTTYPGAVEIPDEIDNDCDDEIDEDFADPGACYYTVFISEIADPNDNAGARYVELFNSGDEPFSLDGYYLARWTNSDFSPSSSSVPLDGLTVEPMSTVVICANIVDFTGAFPGSICDLEGGDGGPVDSNGDDQIALANGPLDAGGIVDFYGVIGEDGTGTDHEFEDGQAMRSCPVTCASNEWSSLEWDISNDGGAGFGAVDTTDGVFTPGSHCDGSTAPLDSDGDGVSDDMDVCPDYDDTVDADMDGTPDGCDVCAGSDDSIDTDLDGVPDGCDTGTGTTSSTGTTTTADTCSTTVYISEIADPNDNADARYLELFNDSSADVSLDGYALRRWTNSNFTPSTSSDIQLDGWIMGPGATMVICADAEDFADAFGVTCDLDGGTGGPADSNGDDQIALIFGEDIIDFFGVIGEDGSGTGHEFEDGQAERMCDITCASADWYADDWSIHNDGGAGLGAIDTDDGVFTPGVHCDG